MKLINIIPEIFPWLIISFDYKHEGYSLERGMAGDVIMIKNSRSWEEFLNR